MMIRYGLPAVAALILTLATVSIVRTRPVHATPPPPSAPPTGFCEEYRGSWCSGGEFWERQRQPGGSGAAQRRELSAEDELAQSDLAVLTDCIAVYKALGGGWD
jgi:hypothetical protein